VTKIFITYEAAPDPERYAQHVELCRKVPGATFRHGPVFGSPHEQRFFYYAEFEFPDRDAFNAAVRTPELRATGEDAQALGVPHTVHFAEVA